MAFNTVVTMEKPVTHISLADWNARVGSLRNVADSRRADAFAMRHSSRMLRNETRIESEWAEYYTNEALFERYLYRLYSINQDLASAKVCMYTYSIEQLNSWRKTIELTFRLIEAEIRSLQEQKDITERELAALSGPIAVIGEVLAMRDCRLGAELTYDEPDTEIKNELVILENNQVLLSDRCQKAWEKLTRLEEVRFNISLEIENKVEAVDMDTVQLTLNRNSSGISNKPDPMRNPQR